MRFSELACPAAGAMGADLSAVAKIGDIIATGTQIGITNKPNAS